MSLTRRIWFLHRVVPTAALLASGASTAANAVPAMAAGKPTIDKKSKAHPFLQFGATAEPNKKVSVIVQKKRGAKEKSQDIARSAGGTHQEDLDIINGFVMELPQKAVQALAKNPSVAYISPNAKVRLESISTTQLKTTHLGAIDVPSVWNGSSPATGKGVTVAVLDSGINANHPDFGSRVTPVLINPRATGRKDQNGHGTHVIGTINGRDSLGRYLGVAPDAHVVSIQIADDTGESRTADLIRGLQWVNQNSKTYNIRVVSMSVNGSVPESYLTSPVCAASEVLWLKGIVVVVAAGNRGAALDAVKYCPANDPFLITVGAADHNETTGKLDDSLASFSSRGITQDLVEKPDVLAPGRKIVAPLAGPSSTLAKLFPDRIVDSNYLRLSGTSMATPAVAGVVAQLLERFPTLKPNQVKWLLTNTMRSYTGQVGKAGVVDPVAVLQRAAAGNVSEANQGLVLNTQIKDGSGVTVSTTSYWDTSYWDTSYWDTSYWDTAAFDNAQYEMFSFD